VPTKKTKKKAKRTSFWNGVEHTIIIAHQTQGDETAPPSLARSYFDRSPVPCMIAARTVQLGPSGALLTKGAGAHLSMTRKNSCFDWKPQNLQA
jgi:hypothetical protein